MALSTEQDFTRLAYMEEGFPWEPGIGGNVTAQADKQQLLMGFRSPLWDTPVAGPVTTWQRMALMEWCSVWEPGIGPDVATQADRQQLLWSTRSPLWGEAALDEPVIEYIVRARRKSRR